MTATTLPLDFPPLVAMATREAAAFHAADNHDLPVIGEAPGVVRRAFARLLADLTTQRARDAWCHELARRAGETTENGYLIHEVTSGLRLYCDRGSIVYSAEARWDGAMAIRAIAVPGITAVHGLIPRLRLAILAMETT